MKAFPFGIRTVSAKNLTKMLLRRTARVNPASRLRPLAVKTATRVGLPRLGAVASIRHSSGGSKGAAEAAGDRDAYQVC